MFRFADYKLRLIKAVKNTPLLEENSFRAVKVFRRFFFFGKNPTGESDHPPGGIGDRKHYSSPKVINLSAIGFFQKADLKNFFFGKALFLEIVRESVKRIRRVADAKRLDCFLGETAASEILSSLLV